METKIAVIGTGPGHKDYLTFAAFKRIKNADVVVGGRRLLEEFAFPEQEQYVITADLRGAVEFIKQKSKQKKVAVLVSGDTGVYSFASYLVKYIPRDRVEFYPGISSFQLMFARLKMRWQDAVLASFHGDAPEEITRPLLDGKTVALLTDNKNTPRRIAEFLLQRGISGELNAAVGSNLSYPDESIFRGKLKELLNLDKDYANSVVVIFHEYTR